MLPSSLRSWPTPALLALALLLALAGCGTEGAPGEGPVERDWAAIVAGDTLTALTTYNSTSYFLYRGEPLGYEHDLLKAFAEDQGLALRMRVVPSRDSIYRLLNRGTGDLVADRVIRSVADTARVAFTAALYETPPVLVQQARPAAAVDSPAVLDTLLQTRRAPLPDSVPVRARLIQDPAQLAGERVALPAQSAFESFLVELSDSLTGDITVVELDSAATEEQVIRMVASGDVEYTVSPRNLARLNEGYYTNIYVQPTIGEPKKVVWAVRKNAPTLRDSLTTWIRAHQKSALFNQTYQRYFVDRRGYRDRLSSSHLVTETGALSDYDSLLYAGAQDLGWDWRLLAAQTFHESRFKKRAESWAGAGGLLQLMPATARAYDVDDVFDPEDNVGGAVRFLGWLSDYWDDRIPDEAERRKFVLASYNAGHGHVQDARRLAAKRGSDDTRWNDVAYWLLQKSRRTVYQDPVVQHGFCRGLEPVTYVARILERYEHYKEFLDAEQDGTTAAR